MTRSRGAESPITSPADFEMAWDLKNKAGIFDRCADCYAQFRPGYPDDAIGIIISSLGLGPGAIVCDLGAGPATLSTLLAERGCAVVAVEPVEGMRREGQNALTGKEVAVDYVAGIAEAIPLGHSVFDGVVCGQSFHWFEPDNALREIDRVLKPGCGLAVIWNNRDWEHLPWLGDMERLITKYNPDYDPYYRTRDWEEILGSAGLFHNIHRYEFAHDFYPVAQEVLGLIQSYSYVRAIDEEARFDLLKEIAKLVERARDSHSGLVLRYLTELYVAERSHPASPSSF